MAWKRGLAARGGTWAASCPHRRRACCRKRCSGSGSDDRYRQAILFYGIHHPPPICAIGFHRLACAPPKDIASGEDIHACQAHAALRPPSWAPRTPWPCSARPATEGTCCSRPIRRPRTDRRRYCISSTRTLTTARRSSSACAVPPMATACCP